MASWGATGRLERHVGNRGIKLSADLFMGTRESLDVQGQSWCGFTSPPPRIRRSGSPYPKTRNGSTGEFSASLARRVRRAALRTHPSPGVAASPIAREVRQLEDVLQV